MQSVASLRYAGGKSTLMAEKLLIRCPDDWHLHLRDGPLLALTVADAAESFARAIIMPNLEPPVTTVAAALAYRDRILAQVPAAVDFNPLMTLYLHENMHPDEVLRAADSGLIQACKLYPAGVTTNSQAGVGDIRCIYPILENMQKIDMPLLIHGEESGSEVDIFDRERLFIEKRLVELRRHFPGLRIVFEHISTREAVDYILSEGSSLLAATITPQHLMFNRNHLLAGGIRPHYYCLPVLKRDADRRALVAAATGNNQYFFAGTDSAPHLRGEKESQCGCAGCYSMPVAMAIYARVFENENALERLEDFCSVRGADYYRLPLNGGQLELSRVDWQVPSQLQIGDSSVVPLASDSTQYWLPRRPDTTADR